MKKKITVDKNLCIGSGSCIILDPDFFELDEEGKAKVKAGKEVMLNLNDKQRKKLLDAVKACPAQAISIVDEQPSVTRIK